MSVGGVTVAATPPASQSSLHHHHHYLHHHHSNNNNNKIIIQQQQHPSRAHRGYCPEMFPGTRWDEPKGDGAEVGETLAGDAGVVPAALQVNGDHDLDPRLGSNRATFSQRPSWFHVGPESQPPTSTPLSINVNIVLAEPSPLNGGLKLGATDDDCAAAAAASDLLLLPHINVFRPDSTPAQDPVPRKPPPPYPGTAAPVSLTTGGDGRFHGNAFTMATRLTINYGDQRQQQQQQQQHQQQPPPPYVHLPSGNFLPPTPPRSQPHSPEVDGDVLASLGLQHQLQNHHHHQQQQKPMGHHHPHHQQQQHRHQHQNQQQDQRCIEIVQNCHTPVKFPSRLYTSGPHNHHHHQQQHHQLQHHQQQQQVQQHPEAELQLQHQQQQQQLLQHCLNSPSLAQSQQSHNHHHEHDLYQRDVSADDADHNNVAQQHHCLHSNNEQQQHQRESVYNQQHQQQQGSVHNHQQESVQQQHQKQQQQSVHHHQQQQQPSVHHQQQQESVNHQQQQHQKQQQPSVHHHQQQESVNHQQQQHQKQQQQSVHHHQQQQESVNDQPLRHQQESRHQHQHHHQQVTPRLPGAPRSSRRSNPELEKRRIHHCLFPGWIPCRGLLQGVHQEFSPESSPEDAHRREAVRVRVGRLHVEVRALRRADATLPQAHGLAALPVPRVRPGLLSLRPPGAAQQAAPVSQHAPARISSSFSPFPPRRAKQQRVPATGHLEMYKNTFGSFVLFKKGSLSRRASWFTRRGSSSAIRRVWMASAGERRNANGTRRTHGDIESSAGSGFQGSIAALPSRTSSTALAVLKHKSHRGCFQNEGSQIFWKLSGSPIAARGCPVTPANQAPARQR
ncbi:alpha-protein kinase 1-like isoform X1 [Lethenteron reissneri]|uniref:alpha-protein kinase 1-like isoform X1 n=1 Tax=Lethenteron reissneri TaxID=7753 RepID=UPI002AB7458E|nr:alpha-protein kinase 1-like isoform X1 [Lethenteron reissneri]